MRVALAILACIVTAAVGAFFGARWGLDQGPNHFVWVDAPARSVILVSYLRQLRSGNTEPVIHSLELELDSQLMWHEMYLRDGKPFLLSAQAREYLVDAPRYLKRAVAYRCEYPSVLTQDVPFQLDPSATDEERRFQADLIEGGKEAAAAVEHVIQLYGDKCET